MSATVKWPDFHLASTLRSLVGSQSRVRLPEKHATDHDAPIADRYTRDFRTEDHETRQDADDLAAMMADPQGQPVDDLDSFEGFEDGAGTDADFGTLEMFDSNSSQVPYSSHADSSAPQQAPEAVMSEQLPLSSHSKKSKRDKKNKKKKKHSSLQNESSQSIVESSLDPKTEYLQEAAHAVLGGDDTAAAANGDDDTIIPSTQSRKKRKRPESADGKRHKKRRSHERDVDDVVLSTQQSAADGAFLRRGQGKGAAPENVIYEEGAEEDEAATRDSPSAARLRRRSQSRDALSRENSVPLPTGVVPMDVDDGEPNGDDNTGDKAPVLEAPVVTQDVETLARKAWNEHINSGANAAVGVNDLDASADDVDTADVELPQGETSVYELPTNPNHDPEPANLTPRRPRSTRAKKSKPTFYEQPPELEDDDADEYDGRDGLPSPSAMTPKPRRAQPASRKPAKAKRAKGPKLSQSMRGASVDPDAEGGGVRRNKMAGYTQGRFSEEELDRIKKAVESFRSQNGLTQQEVNEMIQAPGGTTAGDDHAQLWVRIFAECPDRHRQKVINIARKKFHNFVARGTWTTEQDAELTQLINVHGTKWSHLAGLINRHPEDIRDRYRNYLVCGDAQRKDAWNEDEESKLTQYVIEAMEAIDDFRRLQPNQTLMTKTYEELIDWQSISERMNRTRSRLQCITKWKWLHIRTHGKDKLASNQPDSQISFRLETARRQIADMREEEQYRLVMAIQGSAAGTDAKIPWQKLVDKQFRNKWHRSSQFILWQRLKQTIPDWQKKTARDIAQELMSVYNQTGELPNVTENVYNDAAEMAMIQSLPASSGVNGTSGAKTVSDEYVVDSDGEGEGGIKQNGNDGDEASATGQDDIQIDPALTEASRPAKKATPAKKTPSKRPASRKKSKTTPAPTQDPIEDDEVAELGFDGAQDDDSEIDIEQFRKKKTPSKFKASGGRKSKGESPHSDSESAMDDMEDLPARIAA